MDQQTTPEYFTLVESLQSHASARATAQKTAFTYFGDVEPLEASITFQALDRRARSLAAHLQTLADPGDRVLLAYRPSLDYISAFFGCLYAGVIAVPALPPASVRTLPRLQLIAADAQPRVALTSADVAARMDQRTGMDDLRALHWLATDDLPDASAQWMPQNLVPADIAFLQYTSGSTGAPKGVMVSHANILANIRAIGTSFPLTMADNVVSWLPPHHDMGLISKILLCAHGGNHCLKLTPALFLKHPYRWLKLITDHRARFTVAPNFAYQLCVDQISDEQKQTLDLSSLEFACNGAEPIRPQTVQRFAEAFAVCGFRPESTMPVYGLAEGTLMIASNARKVQGSLPRNLSISKEALASGTIASPQGAADTLQVVSVGVASEHHEVIIVDPATQIRCNDGSIGEIWVRGPSVAHGYWNRLEESQHTFGATLAGQNETYLRTGDLGFVHSGKLYIAGRSKDLMIFNGRNIYPQDVESTVERVDPAFRSSGCAAFSLEEDHATRLVLVIEVESRKKPRFETLVDTIRAEIAEQHEVFDIAAILLVKSGRIPRTSSGKLQRSRCKALFLANEMESIWSWRQTSSDRRPSSAREGKGSATRDEEIPAGEIEITIAQHWREVLGLARVGRREHFFDLGGHSLAGTQLASRLRESFGVDISLRDLFIHPTVETQARWVGTAGKAAFSNIPSVDRTQPLPLSWAQQRLWFLDQRDHDANAAYQIPVRLLLTGPLNRKALRSTLDRIVSRHEVLRSAFVSNGGEPVQVIAPADIGFALLEHDLRAVPEAEQRDRVTRLIHTEVSRPFDLARGPLIRGQLLQLSDDEHLLLLNQHHIVSDGWSLGLLIKEVIALYTAFNNDQPDPLPPLCIQYADYAQWQRQWLQGETLNAQVEFWRNQLTGAPALLELPTDRPRPAQQNYLGATIEVQLGQQLSEQIKQLSRRHGATLYMTLLASWATLLGRLSQQQTVVIGSTVAGRTRTEIEPLIGFFINMLALPVQVSDELTVSELLQKTKQQVLEAQQHQELPFEQVVEIVQPARSLAYTPLFQVLFDWQTPLAPLQMPGLELSAKEIAAHTAKFDLSLSLSEGPAGIGGTLNYATALFDEQTVRRYLRYWRCVLESMVRDESCPVARLNLLPAEEREQLLVQWNATTAAHSNDQTIHQLFEAQVAAHPHAPALLHEGQSLTYGELNAKANRLAHGLLSAGVRPDDRVALHVERGLDMMVALFGILKAGAAYVPLDPSYPRERLAFMLTDCRPAALVTQAALEDSLPRPNVRTIILDDDDALAHMPEHDPDPVVLGLTHGHLAYVIYTSGSTGQPKGVMIEHACVVNFLNAMSGTFEMTRQESLLAVTTLSFDIAALELFLPLINGARVVLASRADAADATFLEQAIDRLDITMMQATPATWRLLLNNGWRGAPRLKALCGGEALTGELSQSLRSRVGSLWNLYGPTEATIWSTYRRVESNTAWTLEPIGRPIENTTVYLLDAHRMPVPIGVAGEIYIGGAQVARGYFNRPDLTQERFPPDPFSSAANARLYKTGDLGRYLPDGTLLFIGRNDFQVKLRGFRIELEEIEARLSSHPGVRQAVVIAREDVPGEQRLVAYLVPDGEVELSIVELRTHLASALPEYMVPAAYVMLDALPLTPNGKLDRKALPAPDDHAYAVRAYEAPRGEIESALASIWCDVLRIERVGRQDNFFELGGHSLLAVHLIERMRQRQMHADIRTLFKHPSLQAFAQAVREQTSLAEVIVPPNEIEPGCTQVTPEKLPLLQLNQQQIDLIVGTVPGGAANIQDIYPLAPLQEGILFHHLLQHHGDDYLLAATLGIDSRALLDRFVHTLQLVIDRHDILRTAVLWEGLPEPVQVVRRQAQLLVQTLSLQGPDVQRQLEQHSDPSHYRLDVRQAPMMRSYAAFDAQAGRWLLRLVAHHLIADHGTVEALLQEAGLILAGQAQELHTPLPFRNFVAHARLGVSNQEHERFFGELLRDVPEPTTPYGLMQAHADSLELREAYLRIDATLSARLRSCARALGMSAASICHLAFAQTLARVSGCDDVVFGTVLLGRMQAGTGADRALGMFINTLPIRIQIGETSVRDSARQVHALLADLMGHEHASLALAQRCSPLPASTPLFSALLNYRRSTGSSHTLSLEGIHTLHSQERTHYPFTLDIDDFGDSLQLTAKVQKPAEPQRACDLMRSALEELVTALERNPQLSLHTLDVLPAAEREQLLTQWNATQTPFPAERCMHELFEAQVARTPDAIALVCEDRSMRYGELNACANQLAHHLVALGVRPDDRVALCAERSLEMMIGFFAILKAGAAYVPVDPSYPSARLDYLLNDAAPKVLLTQARLRDRFATITAPIVVLDRLGEEITRQRTDNPDPTALGLRSDHLAYVLYTSGSTGQPKGVMVEHRALVNRIDWMQREYALDHTDVVLQKTPIGFDVSMWELTWAFMTGARLVLARPEGHKDSAYLSTLIRQHSVTTLHFVPSMLRMMVAQSGLQRCPSLRRVFCSGEALPADLVKAYYANNPAPLHNLYGPTEAAIDVSYWPCPRDGHLTTVPIGRPIQNITLYVLDAHQQLAPIGSVGELYIGGVGLARGYLNRPELTHERFIANPFHDPRSPASSDRLYKTGDLVRYLPDGNLVYLGRNDFQVKIRGFRIELEEIEAQLSACPSVRQAVVSAREDMPGEKRLVAYVIAHEGVALSIAELRTQLASALPEYMVPAAYVMLDALPITPNGKLDRKALPSPDGDAYLKRTYEAPVGDIEIAIASLWQELLHLERVGRHDHFFELGGHSLLAMQLVSRVRQVVGVDLALRDLFATPTLNDLAQHVARANALVLPPIQMMGRDQPLPLSWAQQRLWFLDQFDPAASRAYHMPAALRLRGTLDTEALQATLDRIVERHEILRTAFGKTADGEPVQVIAAADVGFALDRQDLRKLTGIEQQAAVERSREDAFQRPFDLTRGPLIRGQLLQLADDEHVLFFCQHHIVSDGWSIGLLIKEVVALYTAFNNDQPDPLPPLCIQYADYAQWQRQWLQGETLNAQVEFWRNHLTGAPALLELPTDRPRPAQQNYLGATIEVQLGQPLSEQIKQLSRRHGTTLYMTLLASWATLLGRLSQQQTVVIGSTVAGRTRTEIEPLIGFFINMLALPVQVSDELTVSELLQKTKQQVLEAQQHQELPFEQVVEIVQPARSLAYTPLFQVLFDWQTPLAPLQMPGLELSAKEIAAHTAKFDLSLSLSEGPAGISGTLNYATALFDEQTVRRYLRYWRCVLESMVRDEGCLLARLNLLPAEEREQLLVQWNVTAAAHSNDQTIHQLFEAQVAAHPNAPALLHEGQSLTYGELNAKANRLAHHLLSLGVRPDDRVAICVERSLEMVVGILGILKAAGAYVPLDPNLPRERLEFMLADARPVALLTQRALDNHVPAGALPVIFLDEPAAFAETSQHNPDAAALGVTASSLAYVIYTSGSTGSAKGVMVEHRSAVNFWHVMCESTHSTCPPCSRIGLNASFFFDMSLKGLLQLLSGHCLVLIPQQVRADGARLLQFLEQQRIDAFDSTPSQLDLLLNAGLLEGAYQPKSVLLGGEPINAPTWQRLRVARSRFYNMYGPTECTVDASIGLINGSPEQPHIGRPIANTQIYLLDAHRQPVPVGVTGEIYIGGVQVARGYLNRPELTQERFLSDPFSSTPNARMYKTGDLGRYLADGNIAYLGRNDFQVKIRGFRIELGEIEAKLREQSGVREAVVLAREDEPGEKRLVAYLIANEGVELQITHLRTQLASALPEYMVPAAYVMLDSLPLTPNGKLDRKALPSPDGDAYLKRTFEAPQSAVESALANIWREVLRIERVGRHDNFFELGGHSLLAVQLMERMRQQELYADIQTLFKHPNLEEFARAVSRQASLNEVVVPPNRIEPGCTRITPDELPLAQLSQEHIDHIVGKVPGGVANIQDIYPLAPLQEGMLFHHLLQQQGDVYVEAAMMSFDSRSRLEGFTQALQRLIDRHDILRTAFLWEGLPEPVQVVWRHAKLPIEEVALDPAAGAIIEQLRERFGSRRSRLEVRNAPLLHAVMSHDAANDRWLLLLRFHHLVSDHNTLEAMVQEVGLIQANQPHRLRAPFPFRNVVAQARLGVPKEEHERFFTQLLSDVDQPTTPYGLMQVHGDGSDVHEVRQLLDSSLSQRLRQQARRLAVSTASLVHLAFAQVLSRTSGRDDVLFGTVLFGRMSHRTGANEALGLFINTLPIRIRLDGMSVADGVRHTHQSLMQLLRHEHASLALTHRCSSIPKELPLFSAFLNYRHSAADLVTAAEFVENTGMQLLGTHERSNYPFCLDVDDFGDTLQLTVQVQAPLQPQRVFDLMRCSLEELVKALEIEPRQLLRSLDVLPPVEREQVLIEWNGVRAEYPLERCVHELFEEQAARAPEATAVVHENRSLTYGQLNAQSNRLAHYLRELGVVADSRVAMCVDPGAQMVIGLLAILKAGGCYVPLNAAYPPERTEYMLRDSAPVVVLTLGSGRSMVADCLPQSTHVVDLEADAARWCEFSQENLSTTSIGLGSRHLAYVIYTSGSTGQPKGVMVEHRGLVNYTLEAIRLFALHGGDTVLQQNALTFDLSIEEIMPALLAGARLAPSAQLFGLRATKTETSIHPTVVHLTAAHWHSLVGEWSQSGTADVLEGVRLINVTGDAVSLEKLRQWQELKPAQTQLINTYGPTEATVSCTADYLRYEGQVGCASIGKPFANTPIYILDDQLRPAPVGVSGEIYIGGVQVARGYLNREQLTNDRFVTDPFGAEPQARMYRTGDLGRWTVDGSIEFLGRNDFQVKVGGFRIELGEIESRLLGCDGIREAVVIAREDTSSEKRLVAYLVPDIGVEPSIAALRTELATTLPEYMVPAAYVMLDSLPLTPNGKLDRRALPSPDANAYLKRTYEAPAGEIEIAIAAFWQDLLRIEHVDRQDHFFELGGHSLIAVQLVSRLRQAFDVDLALRDLFDFPTLCDLARHIADATALVLPPIQPADRTQHLPLSWAQQRLWFLHQLDPAASRAYHMSATLQLRGSLDSTALQAALDRIVARHESLRTTFVDTDSGEPILNIAAADRGFALHRHDLSNVEAAERHATFARLTQETFDRPFDLVQGPLIRGELVQLAPDDHALLFCQHHIVSDGWSIDLLVQELSALYSAFIQKLPDPLPSLAIQYADYALWQRQWLQGKALQAQIDFWRDHLAGAPALLELPTDHPRPAVQSYAGASVPVTLSADLTNALEALGRQHGTTLFMTLLAGWAIVLSRRSGQNDLVIGTPVAGRHRTEIESLIGFFVNTLALRVKLDDELTVAQLLDRIKTTAIAASAHQDVPFEQVVEAVQPVRTLSHSPLFQVLLSLENPQGGTLSLPGLDVTSLSPPRATAQFDLSLSLLQAEDVISGELRYASDLFERATIERFVRQLESVLRAMVADESQRIRVLTMLPAAEREQLLTQWNATQTPFPAERCMHELFEAQVARTPDAIALVCEDRSMRYGELNACANQLAHHLVALGVRPDDRVALCAERSLEMMVGFFAILKAGAAYAPVDPSYPRARLDYLLNDAAPKVLLTQARLRDRFATITAPIVVLDSMGEEITRQRTDNPDPTALGLRSDHLAYVLYTSGSTGQPKGVMVEHRALVNRIDWMQREYALDHTDVVLQKTPIGFDVSMWELTWAFMTGARLVLARPEGHKDSAYLSTLIRQHGVTTLHFVPSMLRMMVAQSGLQRCPSLRRVFCSGEALPADLVKAYYASNPAPLHNLYGPTEAAIDVSYWPCPRDGHLTTVPIGRPIQNITLYVLDAHQQLAPIGSVGELYIGGVGLARGYLNRPELTHERFIANPFHDPQDPASSPRLYKTGDLVRYLPDGNLVYLGRNDFQVKIRGFRIELEEIEAQLSACRGVREAAVIAREDVPGEKRLVAYLIAHEGVALSIADLRTQLAAALPEYMVPAAYVMLDALPITPNGKLDRKALPSPDGDAYLKRTYEAPAGDIEIAIASLWQELLHLERVGRHDHFFELGGHSLLAMQLVSRLRQVVGVDLALRDLFATPTLSDLAQHVARANALMLPPIQVMGRDQPLPLSWAQQRLWFLDQFDPAASRAYHMPAALRLRGTLDTEALQATLDRIVERHEILRTAFGKTADGEPVQVIAAADVGFALDRQDLRKLTGIEQQAAVERSREDAFQRPFDLTRGPLIRGQLLQLADDEHVLFFCQHHIVSDGWSIGLLIKEVVALYAAFSNDQPDPLPPLCIQYADYAQWQRQWLQGETLNAQVEFWRNYLTGAPALLGLPTDRPRPTQQSYVGASLPISLSKDLSAALRGLSQRHGATLFMTLFAGWATLLARISGQRDLVIGTPVANRQRTEVEPLIGFFVNTLALRIELDDDPTVTQLLDRVKANTLAAYAHQDVPFEQVVEALQPARTLSHSPLFQVLLSLDNTPAESELTLPDLSLTALSTPHSTTHFDLSLLLTDSGDVISGSVQYARDLFDESTISRIACHFQTLLSAMVADTGSAQRIQELALLTVAERQQLLFDRNATAAAHSNDQTIHQLFEAQVAAYPNAPALLYEGQSLSYGELNAKANRLAHHLLSLGVRPDDRVAICVERSLEMVVGILGILKAAGAYVPLDPNLPRERLEFMLADARPVALLTQRALDNHVPAGALPVIFLDEPAAFAETSQHNPDAAALGVTASSLAYVIYTSGSTGSAKGVMVEHRSAVNFWHVMCESTHSACPPRSRIGLNASFFFDMSLKGLLQLLSGHCLVLIPQQVRADGARLLQFLEQQRIDAFDSTPSQLDLLLNAGLLEGAYQPKSVLLGGEPINAPTWQRLRVARSRFYNMYGPTECTVDASIGLINGSTEQPHIGRPIANTQIYLLDAHRQPVPVGVTGEIYIGGVQVARGYLNRPELTQERFLPDPFSSAPNARMYKTGDLGRYLADGNIAYLGRNDFQVKIRGFRIELGEIEAKLREQSGVREAVVLAREDEPGEKRLVAYLVANEGAELQIAQVRTQLGAALPEYMVPAAYVMLDSLPLTPNGKLDRKALPSPDGDAYPIRVYEAPVGEIETTLRDLWCELLRLERVGRNDNFFELGGHSLLATRLIVRMQDEFDLNVPLIRLFQHATIRALATVVAEMQLSQFDANEIVRASAKFDQLSEDELLQLLQE